MDADQVPHWIRAHFVMEERWGELEAEHSAAAQAVHLAEAWGMVRCARSFSPEHRKAVQFTCRISLLLSRFKGDAAPWHIL